MANAQPPQKPGANQKLIFSSSCVQSFLDPSLRGGERQLVPTNTLSEKRRRSSDFLHPAKRHRGVDMRRRHPDFWYPDGSVVLQLENVMFRLHRPELERRSKYFAGLFRRPPPVREGGEAEVVDGCPVYRVPGQAKDFARLLRAVDDAILYVHAPPEFLILASILRAATMHGFPAFRAWAVRLFEDMWPRNLSSVTSVRRPHAAESIVLARACGISAVLRHAFYELARYSSSGHTTEKHENSHSEDEEGTALSPIDTMRLVELREHFDSPVVRPQSPSSCRGSDCSTTSAFEEEIMDRCIFVRYTADPLGELQGFKEFLREPSGLCESCVRKAIVDCEKQRETIWEEMDVWLGLV